MEFRPFLYDFDFCLEKFFFPNLVWYQLDCNTSSWVASFIVSNLIPEEEGNYGFSKLLHEFGLSPDIFFYYVFITTQFKSNIVALCSSSWYSERFAAFKSQYANISKWHIWSILFCFIYQPFQTQLWNQTFH